MKTSFRPAVTILEQNQYLFKEQNITKISNFSSFVQLSLRSQSLIIMYYSGTPPYGHLRSPRHHGHQLIQTNFFGPLVTVLTGFHYIITIIIDNFNN